MASMTMDVVEEFYVSPKDIAIVTCYQARYEFYRASIRNLKTTNPDWNVNQVQVKRIDGYQGGEAVYVTVDLVVTDRLDFVVFNCG